jgi:transposase
MARAYSADMRERVIARVESSASRHEAAEHYEVSASTAVIWVKCFRETGRCSARPRGGSTSPLEQHAEFLLALIEDEPDLTLDEVLSAMRKREGSTPRMLGRAQIARTGQCALRVPRWQRAPV